MFRGNYWRGNPMFRAPFMPNRPPRPCMPPGPPRSPFPQACPPFPQNPYSMGEPRARTVKCGELRVQDVGDEVEIAGRIQNVRLNRFIILRDDTGATQLVAADERIDLQKKMNKMPPDSYVRVRGQVRNRPANSKNNSLATGAVEVLIREFITVQYKRKWESEEEERSAKKAMKNKPGALKLTTEEVAKAETPEMRSYFAARKLTCGDLVSDAAQPGDEVTLCGWVKTKRPPLFMVLKDGHGTVQLVPSTVKPEMTQTFKDVPLNTIVFIKGILARRPFGQGNVRHMNGMVEVSVTELTVIDKNSPLCEVDPSLLVDTKLEMEIGANSELVHDGEETSAQINKYTGRSHTCGELRGSNVGETVTLMGWLEFVRLTKFLILRDGYGSTQILISESDVESNKLLNNVSLESIVKVTGTVCARPPAQIKEDSLTGEIEVLASSVEILNEAKRILPFNIREHKKAGESLRLKHRYLDLRFKETQNNLRIRSQVLMKMREFLINQHGFVEVETPTLFKRTPGGAREFVVPTHEPGLFYSLVQSPQQLKQLLMVGAMDRYFQVARCYRDETTRPDRQPEFTQLDIELSFCEQEDVMKLIEDLLVSSWPNDYKVTAPFPRISYAEAMETYGSDKPDLRYDWKMINVTEDFVKGAKEDSKINVMERIAQEGFAAHCMVVPYSSVVQKSYKKVCEDNLKEKFPLSSAFVLSKSIEERLRQLFGDDIANAVTAKIDASEENVLFIALGNKQQVCECGGSFRQQWAELVKERGIRLVDNKSFKFLWVTDFPLFSTGQNGKLESTHHPFTAPHPDDHSRLFTEPEKVFGQHYDLVINGSEVGGGSIRIHNGDTQERVLKEILNLPVADLQHLLDALRCGAPPHGGIALGIDRLISIMVGANSIRDVIAFPKGVEGRDPLTGAPSKLNDDEMRYYHQVNPETSEPEK